MAHRSSRQTAFLGIALILITADAAVLTPFPETAPATTKDMDHIGIRAALARDARYATWPTASTTGIPYRLDPGYTTAESGIITQALTQIQTDMNQCIRFVLYNNATHSGQDNIYFGRTFNNGVTPGTCFSFPGRNVAQAGRGQKLAMFSGVDGCLSSVKEAMGFIVKVLGLRNELQRPDRATAVQVFLQNIKPTLRNLNILQQYTANQVDFSNTAFDFNSITIPAPEKYAISGLVLYTSAVSGRPVGGTLPRLSLGDCQGIALLYPTVCVSTACVDPYVNGGVTAVPPVTAATFGPGVPVPLDPGTASGVQPIDITP
ncbi:hypothetical protein BV898_04424 [Hypsibius exemplaris]|uniref:Peptidase metallopeptidase domain-containing protein n=1 Tax=Hypsibius exemplaris TaxID=2072580 RepID=A0A1W0X2F9_HYPEX|nr:hypothetical protein BV898_04424 [Hypsibius exemplaris]